MQLTGLLIIATQLVPVAEPSARLPRSGVLSKREAGYISPVSYLYKSSEKEIGVQKSRWNKKEIVPLNGAEQHGSRIPQSPLFTHELRRL